MRLRVLFAFMLAVALASAAFAIGTRIAQGEFGAGQPGVLELDRRATHVLYCNTTAPGTTFIRLYRNDVADTVSATRYDLRLTSTSTLIIPADQLGGGVDRVAVYGEQTSSSLITVSGW